MCRKARGDIDMGYRDDALGWEAMDDARLAWRLALSVSRMRTAGSRTEGTPPPPGGGGRSHSVSLRGFLVVGGGLSRTVEEGEDDPDAA